MADGGHWYARDGRPVPCLVFDIESYAVDGVEEYLEPPTAPANYKDAEKIKAYCEQAAREQVEKAALDIDLGRIVALGFWVEGKDAPTVQLAKTEDDERRVLIEFWARCCLDPQPVLVGYNCIGYDLPMMLRRSLYLGVSAPVLKINRYRHDGIEDLLLRLSFDASQKLKPLNFYVRRFGLNVEDEHDGGDVAALVKADQWEAVAAHCRADVMKTALLASKLGLFDLTERET